MPPQITYQSFEDFSDDQADELVPVAPSEWAIAGQDANNKQYVATPTDGAAAVSLFELDVENLNVSSVLDVEATVSTGADGMAGFIFDRYNENTFKFVAVDVANNQVIIGHHTAKSGWVTDTSYTPGTALTAGTDYTLSVGLKGTSVGSLVSPA